MKQIKFEEQQPNPVLAFLAYILIVGCPFMFGAVIGNELLPSSAAGLSTAAAIGAVCLCLNFWLIDDPKSKTLGLMFAGFQAAVWLGTTFGAIEKPLVIGAIGFVLFVLIGKLNKT